MVREHVGDLVGYELAAGGGPPSRIGWSGRSLLLGIGLLNWGRCLMRFPFLSPGLWDFATMHFGCLREGTCLGWTGGLRPLRLAGWILTGMWGGLFTGQGGCEKLRHTHGYGDYGFRSNDVRDRSLAIICGLFGL